MKVSINDIMFEVMEKCRQFNVTKIKTKDFEIEFGPCDNAQRLEGPAVTKKIDSELMEDIRMSQMMIDDPFGFEKELIKQENRRFMDEDSGHSGAE